MRRVNTGIFFSSFPLAEFCILKFNLTSVAPLAQFINDYYSKVLPYLMLHELRLL